MLAQSVPASIDLSAVTTALTSSVGAGQITSLIAAVLGASIGLVLIWWGSRKLFNAVMTAFKTGKIKF